MLAYHEATKHTIERLRASPHTLDWVNMPDPYRHYEGVPLVDLPATADRGEPLAWLLYHTAAISAAKVAPSTGYRYALRVNPSSGNLHPTEFHFATRGFAGWEDGLYHYRPSSHMVELRMRGRPDTPMETLPDAGLVFVLTSIAWREAWKYRDRAYRYCLLDIGHAWGCLALAAGEMGWAAQACGHFADPDVAAAIGVTDEWPMLMVTVSLPGSLASAAPREWLGGTPNVLSAHRIEYPSIGIMHECSSLARPLGPVPRADPPPPGKGEIVLPAPAAGGRPFAEVVRGRRSALDFRGGWESISKAQLAALLHGASRPFHADFDPRFVSLYLYVHRVDGLERGVYRFWPDPPSLELLQAGDQRLMAAGLSLGQDLAANCCVAFSMVADLERAGRAFGNRAYRYCHFEAGHIGQRLYVAAESMGLQCTGIGAFYDDQVHRHLGIEPCQGQVIYHFAIGYAVHDPRLDARSFSG